MVKEYVVSTKSGQMYRSYFKIPLPFYCFCNTDVSISSSVRYSDARKFRSLRWATHRAKYLSNHSGEYYYVFTAVAYKDGLYLMKIVDDTINDKLIEKGQVNYPKIEMIIEDWKADHYNKKQ